MDPIALVALIIAVLTLLVAFLALTTSRISSGLQSPVRISKPRLVPLIVDNRKWWSVYEESRWKDFRVIDLHIQNRSSVEQTIRMDGGTVFWPPSQSRLKVTRDEDFTLPPNSGGNIEFLVTPNYGFSWPSDELRGQWYLKRHVIRLRGQTASGYDVNYLGVVRFRYFKGSHSARFESQNVRSGVA